MFEHTTSVWACLQGFRKGEYVGRTLVESFQRIFVELRFSDAFRLHRKLLGNDRRSEFHKCCAVSFTKTERTFLSLTTSCRSRWYNNTTSEEIAKINTFSPRHPLTCRRTGFPLDTPEQDLSVELSFHHSNILSLLLERDLLEATHAWWISQTLAFCLWCSWYASVRQSLRHSKRINNEFEICLIHRISSWTVIISDLIPDAERDEIHFWNILTKMV